MDMSFLIRAVKLDRRALVFVLQPDQWALLGSQLTRAHQMKHLWRTQGVMTWMSVET